MERLFQIAFRSTVLLLGVVLFFFSLSEARLLLYPLTLAVFFAYLLYPIAAWLEGNGAHRIVANMSAILLAVLIIGSITFLIYSELSAMLDDLPTLKRQAQNNLDQIGSSIANIFHVSDAKFRHFVDQHIKSTSEDGNMLMDTVFPSATSTMMAVGILPVYVFLLLFYRNKIYDFILMVFPPGKHRAANRAIADISQVTRRYMGGVFLVVLILCVINSVGMLLIGLKYALLFGVISAICNFIPYFGTLIGALFPLAMAILTGESPQQALSVILFFLFVQFTENNILTPNITGGSVQINPLATIIGLIAGGMVWGVPGMFVVVPLLGMLKILLEHNEATKPYAFLIGTAGTEEHALRARFVKRSLRRLLGQKKR